MQVDTRHPERQLQFSTGERDGKPIVVVINVALAQYGHCREFPWLVEVVLHAHQTLDNGLPTLDEVDSLNAAEEQILAMLPSEACHFVARQTWNSTRQLDYYACDGPATCRDIEALIDSAAVSRNLTVRATRDDLWATWLPTLAQLCAPPSRFVGQALGDQSVFVKIPLQSGEFGSDEEQDDVLVLADQLAEQIAAAGCGEFDGYEFGESQACLFAYGADADALFAAMEPTLREVTWLRGTVVTRRYGSGDDASTLETSLT